MIKVYICGPMTGLPDYNSANFFRVAEVLRSDGYEVINPAEIEVRPGLVWSDYMKEALKLMMDADRLYVLKGYESSKGAKIEINLAQELEMPVSFE